MGAPPPPPMSTPHRLTLAGRPVTEAALADAVAAENARTGAARGDTPEALNRRWLALDEVTAFTQALAQQPAAVQAEAARHPIELTTPALGLYAFDGLGVQGLSAGVGLHRTAEGWAVRPAVHRGDVTLEWLTAMDFHRRWHQATAGEVSAADLRRAQGHAARLALSATRRARAALGVLGVATLHVPGHVIDDARLAAHEAALVAEVAAAPPASTLPMSRGPRFRYPPGLAPPGVLAEAPPTPGWTAPVVDPDAPPAAAPAPGPTLSAPQSPPPSTPQPAGHLPPTPAPAPPGEVHAVEISRQRSDRPALPLARLVHRAGAIEVVALAPNGERIVADVMTHGVPDLSGQHTVRPHEAPLAFLSLLCGALRGRHRASPLHSLPEAVATAGWDRRQPMPDVIVAQVWPTEAVLGVCAAAECVLGVGPQVDLALPPVGDGLDGARVRLTWRDGWLWISPVEGPAGFRLDGLAVAGLTAPAPVDPGAELTLGDHRYALHWALP